MNEATDSQVKQTIAPTVDQTEDLANAWSGRPAPDWSQSTYEMAIFRAIALEDETTIKSINESYRTTQFCQNSENASAWEAWNEYLRLRHGKHGSLERLLTLVEKNPTSSRALDYVGRIYESFEEFEKAAAYFERAVAMTNDIPTKLGYLGKLVLARASIDVPSALKVLQVMRSLSIRTDQQETIVLGTERQLAEHQNADERLVVVLERLLDLDPADHSTRFALAYKYAEMDRRELALLHYSRIPIPERSGSAWNNLGVTLSRLKMPAKSIAAYRQSENLGETLAMSNLANELIEAGFLLEAAAISEKGIVIENHHPNLDSTLARLKGIEGEEDKIELASLEKARPASLFCREVGLAMNGLLQPGSGKWEGPDCEMILVVEDTSFALSGSYMREESPLRRPSLASYMIAEPSEKRYEVEYRGTIIGGALFGEVSRKSKGDPPVSLLGSLMSAPAKVLMYFKAASAEIFVQEHQANGDFKYYSLRRTS